MPLMSRCVGRVHRPAAQCYVGASLRRADPNL